MGRGPTREFHNPLNDAYVEGTLTCLKPETIRQQINPCFPLVLNIEPTNACNQRCTCCPRLVTVRRQGISFLPLPTFNKIIDEVAIHGPLVMLNLHKDGEPLMHSDLPAMVAYARHKNAAQMIHLNTNGTLLGTPRARRLLDAGIDDITISVDAAFESTYAKLKQVGSLEKLGRRIESFIDYRNKIGGHTIIRVKIMEFDMVSSREIKAFHQRWQGVADQVQVTGAHNWSGAISELAVTDETTSQRFPCALLWYALAVNSNGKVSICNVDWDYSGVVGDICEKSISDIWQDEPIHRIRRAQLEGRWDTPPVCNDCVLWTSIGDLHDYLAGRRDFVEGSAKKSCPSLEPGASLIC